MIPFSLIEDFAGTIFPSINMILIIIISYQFLLLYEKPRGHMYYRPWQGILFAFIFFSLIQILTLLRKLNILFHPRSINAVLELLIILSLIYAVHAIKMKKVYHPYYHFEIARKKIKGWDEGNL
jgi:hypothetical protein